jgi:hypothetical protein
VESKDTNPKDAIAGSKLPLHLVPDTIPIFAALAFTEGAAKYGAYNWRIAGVKASVYISALERHMMKYKNGEWADEKTGVPHLASVLACAGILLDANLCGKLTDDRPPSNKTSFIIDSLEPVVSHIKGLFADKDPHHYTIKDSHG